MNQAQLNKAEFNEKGLVQLGGNEERLICHGLYYPFFTFAIRLKNVLHAHKARFRTTFYHPSLLHTLIQRYGSVHTGFSIVLVLPLALVSISACIELLPMLLWA